jgi:beta-N-acetylhexosaminidase
VEELSAPAPASSDWLYPGCSRRHALAGLGAVLLGGASGQRASAQAVGQPAQHPASLPAGLTHQQLAGQRIIGSYSGLTPPASLLTSIRNGQLAGVIFFAGNISSPTQLATVVRQLRQAQTQSPVKLPLLLMTDQEGGQVRRLPGQPTLSEKQIGQSKDPVAAATAAGTGAGKNLAAVGLNVNLGPVLDVYAQPGNFIDEYQRSYSSDPAVVAKLGQAFITAQQRAKVAATAKHFPGLGSAAKNQNTDIGPVTLSVPLSRLRTVDEAPYPAAIAAGVKLVMVSWAIYPALDLHRPAGLSPTVIQQELRARHRFTGVTITDALEAGALKSFGSTAHRAATAAAAGMDLILCAAQQASQAESATTALASALTGGQLSKTAFDAALSRVTALRAALS